MDKHVARRGLYPRTNRTKWSEQPGETSETWRGREEQSNFRSNQALYKSSKDPKKQLYCKIYPMRPYPVGVFTPTVRTPIGWGQPAPSS